MRTQDFTNAWKNFWFYPESPLSLGVFRIVFGLVFLSQIISQYWIDFRTFFGAHPFIPHEDFVAFWTRRSVTINLFELIPTEDAWHMAFFILVGILALMMTVGFFTRFSTIVVYIMYLSISHQYPFLLNAGDNMQRLVLFLLCFSRSGDCLSVDTYLKNRKGDWRKAIVDAPARAPWAQRMIQVQLAIAYFTTAMLKINSPIWFFGNGLYIATRLNDFYKLHVPVLFDHRLSLFVLDWFAILTELFLGTLIWIRELRYCIILGGVFLHIGIDWAMNIPVFEYAFMSLYILFVDAEDMKKLGRWFYLAGKRIFSRKAYVSGG